LPEKNNDMFLAIAHWILHTHLCKCAFQTVAPDHHVQIAQTFLKWPFRFDFACKGVIRPQQAYPTVIAVPLVFITTTTIARNIV